MISVYDFIIDLINSSIDGILILACALLIIRLQDRISAQIKKQVLLVSFLGLFALFVFTVLPQEINFFPATPSHTIIDLNGYRQNEVTQQSEKILSQMTEKFSLQEPSDQNVSYLEGTSSDLLHNWQVYAFVLWISGFLVVIIRLFVGILGVLRIKKNAVPHDIYEFTDFAEIKKDLRIRQSIQIMTHEANFTPLTFGYLKPVIILPEESIHWSVERLHIALLHELIHIKRADFKKNMLIKFVCAIFWFNPLVWITAKRYRYEQEAACDEQVIGSGVKPHVYAKELLDLTRDCNSFKLVSALTSSKKSSTEKRIMGILRGGKSKKEIKPLYILFAVFLTVCILVSTSSFNFVKAEESAVSSDVPSLWPLQEGQHNISSYFGEPIPSKSSDLVLNQGVDIGWSGRQTNIYASADGIVGELDTDKYGVVSITIQHKNNLVTYYGDLCYSIVDEGSSVKKGEIIGKALVSRTIHFEIRKGDKVIDPLLMVEDLPSGYTKER